MQYGRGMNNLDRTVEKISSQYQITVYVNQPLKFRAI